MVRGIEKRQITVPFSRIATSPSFARKTPILVSLSASPQPPAGWTCPGRERFGPVVSGRTCSWDWEAPVRMDGPCVRAFRLGADEQGAFRLGASLSARVFRRACVRDCPGAKRISKEDLPWDEAEILSYFRRPGILKETCHTRGYNGNFGDCERAGGHTR